MIIPRPYQEDALEATDNFLMHEKGNPCVVIPTGGGKSILMAWFIEKWKANYTPLRVCILAHRKELVAQNSSELLGINQFQDVGIYAAGLKRKDTEQSIVFASIDSIFRKWGEFPAFDVLFVDEAHRIPANGEGKYREFIKGCQSINSKLKVVGFTATPYRMGMGSICHRDHILNKICYEANVSDLIRDGFLCNLRSKVGDCQPDLSSVRKSSNGDYIAKSLSEVVDRRDVVTSAIQSAMKTIIAEKRKSVVFFCIDHKHCDRVSLELRKYGVEAPVVTSKTKASERDRIANAFINGRYKAICNVNVYTEGFNAKRVDCIVLLRPTLSKGMYKQMVGRGLRLHPSKTDCLVLDYAGCISEHGPIDCIEGGETRLKVCDNCGDTFSWATRKCPNCGWDIPKIEVERVKAEVREKKMHDDRAAELSILGKTPDLYDVDEVTVHRHAKEGKPDSLRVQYRCGLQTFREWICLDHGGFAEKKAREWWHIRFGKEESETVVVDGVLEDLFLGHRILNVTRGIWVIRRAKNRTEIVGYKLVEK